MIPNPDERTISQLFGDSLAELAKLVQNEVDLARAELREKARQVGGAAGLIAAGAVLLIPALVLLLYAIAAWLITLGLAPPLAYLASGLGAGIIAVALVWTGIGRLSGDALKPNATMREIERDKNLAKELMR
jgi:Putative Actinobacterial Holin-X, holin superfamily III